MLRHTSESGRAPINQTDPQTHPNSVVGRFIAPMIDPHRAAWPQDEFRQKAKGEVEKRNRGGEATILAGAALISAYRRPQGQDGSRPEVRDDELESTCTRYSVLFAELSGFHGPVFCGIVPQTLVIRP